MMNARLHPQDVQALSEGVFRLIVSANALVGSREVDAERPVLFAEIARFGLRFMND